MPSTLLKKTSAQVFSYEYCEIFKITFFTEHEIIIMPLKKILIFNYEFLNISTTIKMSMLGAFDKDESYYLYKNCRITRMPFRIPCLFLPSTIDYFVIFRMFLTIFP